MQGGEDSQAAPPPDGASGSVSPIHRLSFAISVDISALSGASSNVEITPMGETLTQPTLAQLLRSNIIATKVEEIGQDEVLREESDATTASDSSRADITEQITAVSPQPDIAPASSAETLDTTPESAQGMTTADSASTQRSLQLHTGARERASQQSQQQRRHQWQSLDGMHLDMHAHMAATPTPSEEELARAMLQEFTDESQEDSLKLKKATALAASTGLPATAVGPHILHKWKIAHA